RLWDAFNADLAIVEHDIARITDLIRRLEPDAGHWAVLGGGVLVHTPVCVSLGRLEARLGRWERALAWAAQGEAEAQRLDADLWLLEARADRLAAQRSLGRADAGEIASTMSLALDRGLMPIVERLRALAPKAPMRAANVLRCDGEVWTLVFDGV